MPTTLPYCEGGGGGLSSGMNRRPGCASGCGLSTADVCSACVPLRLQLRDVARPCLRGEQRLTPRLLAPAACAISPLIEL